MGNAGVAAKVRRAIHAGRIFKSGTAVFSKYSPATLNAPKSH